MEQVLQSRRAIPAHVPADRVVDFDMNGDPGLAHDYFGTWQRLQASTQAALVWTPHNGGHWIATRAEYFRRIFEESDIFSSKALSFPADITSATAFIPLQLDPPEHDGFRKVIAREFGAGHIGLLQPAIRELAVALIEELKPRGECDFVVDYAEILPVHIFLMLVGLPVADRPMLRELVVHLNNPSPDVDGAELVRRVDEYLAQHVEARLRNPGSDLFSRILANQVSGRAWTQAEAMRMCRNLLFGGLDTVVSLLSFVTLFLAGNPAQQARLRAEPMLIPVAAHELTRRFGTTTNGRIVTRDVELDGVSIRAGEMIALPTALHNLDARWLPDAAEVVLDRGPTRHMSMGSGIHRCVGEGLARMELICFLQEWLARIPTFAIGTGAVIMRGGSVGALTSLPLRWEIAPQ